MQVIHVSSPLTYAIIARIYSYKLSTSANHVSTNIIYLSTIKIICDSLRWQGSACSFLKYGITARIAKNPISLILGKREDWRWTLS